MSRPVSGKGLKLFLQPVLNCSSAAPISVLDRATKPAPAGLIFWVDSEGENTPESSVLMERQRVITMLEGCYVFDNPQEIRMFLVEHYDLLSILMEAPFHILHTFGDVPRHLELHHDPEENGATLFIVVKSPYGADEAIRRERRLVDQWFLAKMRDTRGRLNFTEEPL